MEKIIPDATTLIHVNQYNTDKGSLEKLIGEVQDKIPDVSSLVTTVAFTTKIGVVENKVPNFSGL